MAHRCKRKLFFGMRPADGGKLDALRSVVRGTWLGLGLGLGLGTGLGLGLGLGLTLTLTLTQVRGTVLMMPRPSQG